MQKHLIDFSKDPATLAAREENKRWLEERKLKQAETVGEIPQQPPSETIEEFNPQYRKSYPWKEWEDIFLRIHYDAEYTDKEIAKRLNRTMRAVRERRYQLGYK